MYTYQEAHELQQRTIPKARLDKDYSMNAPVIVASLGRSGSSMVAHQIHKAMKTQEVTFIKDISRLDIHTRTVWKTHDPSLPVQQNVRAVYLYDDYLPVIASMYHQPVEWLRKHLHHLHVEEMHQERFWELLEHKRDLAWRYLIHVDRFKLRENRQNWCAGPAYYPAGSFCNIQYEWVCDDPKAAFDYISSFLGLDVSAPTIKKRNTSWRDLPSSLIDAAIMEYE